MAAAAQRRGHSAFLPVVLALALAVHLFRVCWTCWIPPRPTVRRRPLTGGRCESSTTSNERIARAALGGEERTAITYDTLAVGQKHIGRVRVVLDIGAFVDIGCESDGLLHISQIHEGRVSRVRDFLTEGDVIDVWISELRPGGKFGVTMVESKVQLGAGRGPQDLRPFALAPEGAWHAAVVDRLMDFGVFVTVTLPNGVSGAGLVHLSQIRDGFVERVEDELQVGQQIRVRVVSVDVDAGKMALSMLADAGSKSRPAARVVQRGNLSAFAGVSPDRWLHGRVSKPLSYGAFVTATAPDGVSTADGFVHVTQIRDEFLQSTADELVKDQQVRVRVLSVELDRGRMNLTMRDEPRQSANFSAFADVAPYEWLDGKVGRTSKNSHIVRVKAPDGKSYADGMLKFRRIADAETVRSIAYFQPGQRVRVRVESLDVETGKMKVTTKDEPWVQERYASFASVPSYQWLTGKVGKVADTYAIIRVIAPNGREANAFLHFKDARGGIVENLMAELERGQEVKVRVVSVKVKEGKMSVTMRGIEETAPPSAVSAFKNLSPDQWFHGQVTGRAKFGAFIAVSAPGGGGTAEGVLHHSQRGEHHADLKVAQQVMVRVVSVDIAAGKMNVTTKPTISDFVPFTHVSPETLFDGRVSKVSSKGVFVNVTAPGVGGARTAWAPGFVRLTEMLGGAFVDCTNAVARVGMPVRVRVLSADAEAATMALSMRDVAAFASVPPTKWLAGTVVGVVKFGAFVTIRAPGSDCIADGLVHKREMQGQVVGLRVGESARVRVIGVNITAGRMELSMRDVADDT